jgi:hypothetical protein
VDAVWEIQAGRGRKPHYQPEKVAEIVAATLQTKPKGATHWSCRTLARSQLVSKNTVHRIWQEHNLKPHRSRTFKLSRDPKFLEKLTDVVGLYLNPPDKTLVLCVDEKTQLQALDRTQPGLPLKKGRCGTFTHDHVRHGTTTLFAALEMLEGKVIGQGYPRHRQQEFLKFLRRLDDAFADPEMDLHLVIDNYGTHKHPKVKAWLQRHPRFVLHFIPTSSSWLNQVERWFGELTQKAVRRGAFVSVEELQQTMAAFMDAWNEAPRPFVWTATVAGIMEKISRARNQLDKTNPGWALRKKRKKRTSRDFRGIIPTTLIQWYNCRRGSGYLNEEPVENQGAHAPGILPEAPQFGLPHRFLFGQRRKHPVTQAVFHLIPQAFNRV